MALNFPDVICQFLHNRLKQCLPLGLYKIWFRVQETSLEDLGDLLGFFDNDFSEMIKYSALARSNGILYLDTWQHKLGINVEVRPVHYNGERFKTVRFNDQISHVNSREAQIGRSNESEWSNLTYFDREFMEFFRKEYIP